MQLEFEHDQRHPTHIKRRRAVKQRGRAVKQRRGAEPERLRRRPRRAVGHRLPELHRRQDPARRDSSLPPVTIGFVNQQGGQQVIGQHATDGAQMAVNYINKELGGVDGHPVQLDTCFIASAEEEGTTCAQKFLANKSVDVIAMGAVVIGDQSFYATLGGKLPVVGGVAPLPIDGAAEEHRGALR